jgi:hypothetical protein
MVSNKLDYRLSIEEVPMSNMFPYLKLFKTNGEICFKGWYTTTTNQGYILKLILSEHYPDKKPELYVIYPKILRQYGTAISLNDIGLSHAFHTLNTDSQGQVQICHFSSESWHAGCTCAGVMTKAQLWCEAHVEHLLTGLSIDEIITNWKRSKEKWNLNELNWNELLKICPEDRNLMTGCFSTMEQRLLEQTLFPTPEILTEPSKSLLMTSPLRELKLL